MDSTLTSNCTVLTAPLPTATSGDIIFGFEQQSIMLNMPLQANCDVFTQSGTGTENRVADITWTGPDGSTLGTMRVNFMSGTNDQGQPINRARLPLNFMSFGRENFGQYTCTAVITDPSSNTVVTVQRSMDIPDQRKAHIV